MRRVLEKLSAERKKEEEKFQKSLEKLEEKYKLINKQLETFKNSLSQVESQFKTLEHVRFPQKIFYRKFKKDYLIFLKILKEYRNLIEQTFKQINENLVSISELFSLILRVIDAKDREWDALSNNHVSLIFKSMEWRIDKLTNEYQDVKLLMKKFLLIEDKLDSLLLTLQKEKKLTLEQIEKIIEPLRDYKYAGFENRFRGYEENLLRAQKKYLPYFLNKKNVVDLGCGRGEFLQILRENNIESYGVDSNDEMVEICLEKGLKCIKCDLLQHLSSLKDESLEGIFSAQVIEHLPPKYLIELIRKSYFKLKKNCYLVLETINPTSLFSLVNTFFLDLSHQKPIHPQTLKFLFEISGFEEVEIKYFAPLDGEKLQEVSGKDEDSTIINQNFDKLNKLLFAPADYAVIGKKI